MAGSDFFSLEFDTRAFFAALDEIKVEAQQVLDVEAHAAAEQIATDAHSRVLRATGQTAEGIIVQPNERKDGWVVLATEPSGRPANLPGWIEHGTEKELPHPFFDASAQLEAPIYQRRAVDALQDLIDRKGLGS